MDLKKIPKVELHRHLELSFRKSSLKELLLLCGFQISSDSDLKKQFLITEPMKDLGTVLNKFLNVQKIYFNEEIIERLAFEACEDAYNEGICILELRYAPSYITQGHNLSFQQAHDAIIRGIKKAEEKYPMAVGLLCTVQRILSVDKAKEVIHFAIDNKETFIGVDLADDEKGFSSTPFAPLFLEAQQEGLGVTIHSGEINEPDAHNYVVNTIKDLKATRIGHGLQIYRSNEAMDFVKESGVTLELCPTSNLICNSVESLESHPFRKIMEYGVKTTINSDDPGIFDIDLTNEYRVLQDIHGFTLEEFNKCNQNAYEASFIDEKKKVQIWNANFEHKFL